MAPSSLSHFPAAPAMPAHSRRPDGVVVAEETVAHGKTPLPSDADAEHNSALSIRQQKKELRQLILRQRAALSGNARQSASEHICAQLLALPQLANARCVAAFAPMPDEVDIWPVIRLLRQKGVVVALPRVCGPRRMTFHTADESDLVRENDKKIAEPPDNLPRIKPQLFDFCIVPALAVDSRKIRMGYGGGFYDTFMLCCAAPSAAPVFACQKVFRVPDETHDAKVTFVVSHPE